MIHNTILTNQHDFHLFSYWFNITAWTGIDIGTRDDGQDTAVAEMETFNSSMHVN